MQQNILRKGEVILNMLFECKLPEPKEVKEMHPLSKELATIVTQRAHEIEDIFTGKSDKLILIIGS